MINRLTSLCAVMACASFASAQSTFVMPKGGVTVVDRNYDFTVLPYSRIVPVHVQHSYDVADIPVAGGTFKEIAFRRNNFYGNNVPAGSTTMTVQMATSPLTTSAMSTTFATNLKNLVRQVFSGKVSWPAAAKGTGPAPFTHKLKLTTPYIYVRGSNKSLIVDYVITASTFTGTVVIDATGPDVGSRSNNGPIRSQCKFSTGKYNNSLGYRSPVAGQTWYVRYGSLPANAAVIATLSAYGVNNRGPWPLPIPLAGLGAANCFWHVGLELGVWIPLKANASGSAQWPNLTLPAALAGKTFYDHALVVDKTANNWGLVPTWSSAWKVGTGKGPSGNTVYRTQDSAKNATGFLRRGYGTLIQVTR